MPPVIHLTSSLRRGGANKQNKPKCKSLHKKPAAQHTRAARNQGQAKSSICPSHVRKRPASRIAVGAHANNSSAPAAAWCFCGAEARILCADGVRYCKIHACVILSYCAKSSHISSDLVPNRKSADPAGVERTKLSSQAECIAIKPNQVNGREGVHI